MIPEIITNTGNNLLNERNSNLQISKTYKFAFTSLEALITGSSKLNLDLHSSISNLSNITKNSLDRPNIYHPRIRDSRSRATLDPTAGKSEFQRNDRRTASKMKRVDV